MKRCVLAALLLMATPLAGATPASDAEVDRLLDVMRAKQTAEAMVPQVQSMQQQMVQQLTAGQTPTAEQQQALDRIVYQSNARMLARVSWDKMQPLYREIYRQTFSAQDMAAMVDFYGSPAGQNLLDKMPRLMHNTMTAMQQVMVPMLQQMQRDIEHANQTAAAAPASSVANGQ